MKVKSWINLIWDKNSLNIQWATIAYLQMANFYFDFPTCLEFYINLIRKDIVIDGKINYSLLGDKVFSDVLVPIC